MRKSLLSILVVAACLSPAVAFAFGEQTDEYTLELKGYSKELITPIEAQISRMEGRYPTPAPTKRQQFIYNLKNNDWDSSLEPFSYDVVDPPKYPKQHL